MHCVAAWGFTPGVSDLAAAHSGSGLWGGLGSRVSWQGVSWAGAPARVEDGLVGGYG